MKHDFIIWSCRFKKRYNKKRIYKHFKDSVPILVDVIKKQQLKWFGHLCRMKNKRSVKLVLQTNVQKVETRGRPSKIWNEVIGQEGEMGTFCTLITITDILMFLILSRQDVFSKALYVFEYGLR